MPHEHGPSSCWSSDCGRDVPLTSPMPNFCGVGCRDAYWGEQHDSPLPNHSPATTLPGATGLHPVTSRAVVDQGYDWLDIRVAKAARQ